MHPISILALAAISTLASSYTLGKRDPTSIQVYFCDGKNLGGHCADQVFPLNKDKCTPIANGLAGKVKSFDVEAQNQGLLVQYGCWFFTASDCSGTGWLPGNYVENNLSGNQAKITAAVCGQE